MLSAGARASDRVTVSWTAPETDLDVRGYELGWRRAAAASWTEVREIPSGRTTYTITGLKAGTAYEVRVRAVYAGGESEWSLVIAVETAESRPVLSPGPRTSSSVTVSWTAPETGVDLRGYELDWRRTAAANWTEIREIPSGQTMYTITGLEAGAAYEVRVRAVYAGGVGEWSPAIAVETEESAPVLSTGVRTSSSVTVSWTAPETDPDVRGYELGWRRAGAANWPEQREIPSGQTTYTIPGLEAGTAYEVRVRAVYAGGAGEWSPVVAVETAPASGSGTPSPPRTPPIFEIASVSPTTITVNLTATDTAITAWEVAWKTRFGTKWVGLKIPSTTRTYTITGLTWQQQIEVAVRTVTAEGVSEWFRSVARTRGGYDPDAGPRVSVVTDDAIADEGDGAIYFILVTPDRVPAAITVSVRVTETGDMVQRGGGYSVRIGPAGAGGTRVKLRVGLQVDTVDEPDSLVGAEVLHGADYDRGDVGISTIKVRDDD